MSDDLAELTAQLHAVQSRLDELDQLVTDLLSDRASPDAASGPADLTQPLYATVHDWVHRHFAQAYPRHLGIGSRWRWCTHWHEHPEALIRFQALWRTWEAARTDPTGTAIAAWHREHLDHHLPILLTDDGPFYTCTPGAHDIQPPLPISTDVLTGTPLPAENIGPPIKLTALSQAQKSSM
jgi:hypothetical protein